MATMKDFLRKAVLNGGAKAYGPDETRAITLDANVETYVAPSNGWVAIQAKATAVGAWTSAYTVALTSTSTVPYKDNNVQIFIPVKKGEIVSMYQGEVTNLVKRFLPAVGGGKSLCNQYVRRGCVCLTSNPSFVSSGALFRRSAFPPQIRKQSKFRSLKNRTSTSHQKTDGLFSTRTEPTFKQKSYVTQWKFSQPTWATHGGGAPVPCIRELKSPSMFGGLRAGQRNVERDSVPHAVSSNNSRWEVAA